MPVICLPVCPPVCLPVCLLACLPVYLLACLRLNVTKLVALCSCLCSANACR